MEPKIKSAKVDPTPKSLFDPLPKVTVTYDDDTTEELFSFYPDELSFTESEFIGLTRTQAITLRHDKDVAFLQS